MTCNILRKNSFKILVYVFGTRGGKDKFLVVLPVITIIFIL